MKRNLCNVEDVDSDEDDEAVSTFGGGGDSSGDDNEDTDRTQLAQGTQLVREGSEDSLDDLLLQEDSFEGKELKLLHASWDAWERYRVNYSEEENAHLVVQEAKSVSKRNKQLRESKRAKSGRGVRYLPDDLPRWRRSLRIYEYIRDYSSYKVTRKDVANLLVKIRNEMRGEADDDLAVAEPVQFL
ncbi:hypothetical protein PInf_025140 [Phytophthora infestans]|nr:hypothetical protein PInf_025140 [Phytophthora infestans]